jgi:hypothetical protein
LPQRRFEYQWTSRRCPHRVHYYRWSKEFLEAGKKRLMGDTLGEATGGEVQTMKTENDAGPQTRAWSHILETTAESAIL